MPSEKTPRKMGHFQRLDRRFNELLLGGWHSLVDGLVVNNHGDRFRPLSRAVHLPNGLFMA